CVNVSVEMNDVGTQLVGKAEEPLPGLVEVVPRIVHPFELERRMEDARFRSRRPRAHDGEGEVDLRECPDEGVGVGPDAADAVRGHQYASDTAAACSSSCSGCGRCSWMSLNRLKRRR